MAEKELKARIVHKHDTEANWNKATNFIPKESEFIVYDKDDTHNYFRLKIGDGVTDVINLPFYGGSLEHILDGTADGSVRTSNSAPEDANYKLGTDAFAEGKETKAKGNFSHAEGFNTTAFAAYSHAEGRETIASGSVSHAEGTGTVASGIRSHAGGYGTIAKGDNQTAIGKYNIEDTSNKYAFIVGNGTSSARKNAFTVDWSGNIEANGKALATEEYVDANGGKIDSISVNGSAQEIVDKNVNITIPTKTSDLTNDSNFLSSIPDEYITEEELNLKNYQNDTEVQTKINTEINKLNKDDSAVVGQYVSSVSEENGIITVSRENLPQQIDYTVTITESTPEGFAKVYNIKQTSTGLNATINIPKDMVVSSGKVETYTLSGEWGLAGTYLVLTLANATSDKVYINVGNLIEYVTSGSTADDQIQIEIDNEHKVTAILKNSSVTKEQLDTNLQNELNSKVNKSGDTMTGKLSVPQVETGEAASSYFQARKFRGEGDADTYYHAIDFGYDNHDQVDFHEYGGRWNFYKNQKGAYNTGVLIGSITTNGWEGSAKLTGSPTAPTASKGANNTQIATTAFVQSEMSGFARKPTITTATLLASNWDSTAKTYSFETDYPSASYDIEISLDSTATAEQAEAFNGAQIAGSATSNIIKAYGDVPTVDIPVILKVIKK